MDSINGNGGVVNAPPTVQLKHKFVGSKGGDSSYEGRKTPVPVPLNIKESADILGLDPAVSFTQESVRKAWKQQICLPEHHPDLGGNAEKAILLNTAKDQLLRWLEASEPKLGRLFSKF